MQLRQRLLVGSALCVAVVLAVVAQSASAQSATGTVTGRVVWGPCVRGIPLPMAPDGQTQLMPQPPIQTTGLPAGAVLVAAQNTNVSARTDEAGSFTLSGVPPGQYLTVAAGPVANATSATVARPNVWVSGGQTVDIGTLSLGGTTPFGIACRMVPGVGAASGSETAPAGPDGP